MVADPLECPGNNDHPQPVLAHRWVAAELEDALDNAPVGPVDQLIELDEAVGRLEGFKDSSRQLHDLRDLEDEGDRLNRAAVSELFATAEDPLVVIRWKDIHEQLEEAVDACENAADVLEAILVKNR